MPRIPRYWAETLPPGQTATVARSPRYGALREAGAATMAEVWGQVGRELRETGELGLRVFGRIEAEKRKALEKIAEKNQALAIESKTLEAQNIINEETEKIGEQLNFREDWDTFNSYQFIKDEIQKVRDNIKDRGTFSVFIEEGNKLALKELQNAVEKILSNKSYHLMNIAEAEKGTYFTNKRNFELDKIYKSSLEEYKQEYDPEIKKAIKAKIELTAMGIGSEYAINKVKKFDEDIEKENYKSALVEAYMNPGGVSSIIKKYELKDEYRLPVMKEAENAQTRLDKEAEMDQIKFENEIKTEIEKGTNMISTIQFAERTNRIRPTQYEHLLEYNRKIQEKVASGDFVIDDPETTRRLGLDIHSSNPRTTEKEIDDLVINNRLSLKTAISYKDKLRNTKNQIIDKAGQDIMRRHQQAEQIGNVRLTTRSLFEQLDPVSQELKGLYLEELTRRSAAMGGKEDPLAVKDEILPKYMKVLWDRHRMSVENYRKLLRYSTPQDLENAYKQKRITKGEYESQKEIFLQMIRAEEDAKIIEIQIKGEKHEVPKSLR